MRFLIGIIALILWIILFFWYQNLHNTCCNNETTGVEISIIQNNNSSTIDIKNPIIDEVEDDDAPIRFAWSDPSPILGSQWDSLKVMVWEEGKEGEILEIFGVYSDDEINSTTLKSIGLARADQVKALFLEYDTSRIKILDEHFIHNVDTSSLFEAVNFAWKSNDAYIEEVDDGILIYFPYNSDHRIKNQEVENYLRELAEKHKDSAVKIHLTGHTDNIGTKQSNIILGERRANIIQRFLILSGISKDRISIESAGESQPIGDNNTRSGRAKNRRTELTLIPN